MGQQPTALPFQSTPVIANGRIAFLYVVMSALKSFNPRPLLLTGESDGSQVFRF